MAQVILLLLKGAVFCVGDEIIVCLIVYIFNDHYDNRFEGNIFLKLYQNYDVLMFSLCLFFIQLKEKQRFFNANKQIE